MPTERHAVPLGVVLPGFAGRYDPAADYGHYDMVLFENDTYVAKKPTKGNPPTDTVYWQRMTDIGPPSTITVGEVETGAPGSEVVVTNSGTERQAVLDFTIPAGRDGFGLGDMEKAVYDSDGDGKVDQADDADRLGGVEASEYLQKKGDASGTTVVFTEAKTLAAVASGETHAILWGKVKKLFSSLKGGAYAAIGTGAGDVASGNHTHSQYLETTLIALERHFLNKFHPVDSLYFTTDATNPGKLLGGTWVQWGAGRVPIGVYAVDPDYNAAEKFGGTKTVSHAHTVTIHNGGSGTSGSTAITIAQMPVHMHDVIIRSQTGGDHANYAIAPDFFPSDPATGLYNAGVANSSGGNGGHAHTTPAHSHTGSISETATSIVQPYITCYMWKRTA